MYQPLFWYQKNSCWASLLKPLGFFYALGTLSRFYYTAQQRIPVPVICIGNLSVGGTGKTPICLAIAQEFQKIQKNVYFLTHGYKSNYKHILVDIHNHTSQDVGDEALLLARFAPTVVDNYRARGAQLATQFGAEAIIMDDGFQSPSLAKTFSFVVVDGHKGFGNEQILPAGPLREPILKGLARADAIIIAGEDTWGIQDFLKQHNIFLPVFTGHFQINKTLLKKLQQKEVSAFVGIGNPDKFFNSLEAQGVILSQKTVFPDHYFYTKQDIENLIINASGKPLITTTKDYVKIPKELQSHILVADGAFLFDKPQAILKCLQQIPAYFNERYLGINTQCTR